MKKQLLSALLVSALALEGTALAAAPRLTPVSRLAAGDPARPLPVVSLSDTAPDEAPWDKTSGEIAFSQVARAMADNNPNLLSLTENLASLDAFNREKAYEDLLDLHNQMTEQIWALSQLPGGAMQAQSLKQAQAQLHQNLESLEADNYGKTYEDSRRAIVDGVQQIISIGETLYLQTLGLEQSYADAQRGLAALDRQVVQAEKAFEIGAMSQVDLMNLHNTRASTASQIDTLAYNIELCRLNLQSLLGVAPDGKLRLSPLPSVTARQLAALDNDAALGSGLDANLAIYKAKRKLADEQEKLDDLADDNKEYTDDYKIQQHTVQAAQHSYDAAVQQFTLKFRGLVNQLSEQDRLIGVARQALTVAEKNAGVAALQYERGQLSRLDYLSKKDAVADAESALTTARNNLFATYTQYQWAARGLINSGS